MSSGVARTVGHGLKLWQQIMIALVLVVPSAFAVYQGIDRRDPLIIESVRLVPDKVAPGQDLQVMVAGKVSRFCPGTLTRTLVSASGAPMQVNDQAPIVLTEDGASATMIRTLHVPPGFSPGPAVYRSEAAFACSFLQGWWPIRVRSPDVNVTIESPQTPSAAPAVRKVAHTRPVSREAAPEPASPLKALLGLK